MTWYSDRGGVVARARLRVNQARCGAGEERLTVMPGPVKVHCGRDCEIQPASRGPLSLLSTDTLNFCSFSQYDSAPCRFLLTHGFLCIFLRKDNCGSRSNTLCEGHGEGGTLRTGTGSQEFKPNSRRLMDHLGDDSYV